MIVVDTRGDGSRHSSDPSAMLHRDASGVMYPNLGTSRGPVHHRDRMGTSPKFRGRQLKNGDVYGAKLTKIPLPHLK